MMWTSKEYNEWIQKGCPINLNVTKLNISFSNIKSLNGIENLHNLTTLNCSNNQLISLKGIENLINLTYLNCSYNQLTSLNGIENLHKLINVKCDDLEKSTNIPIKKN